MKRIGPKKAELIGAIIGDGFIHRHKNSYRIGLVGNPITDKEYFEKLKVLIKEVWHKEVKIVNRERGLRMTFGSKEVFYELVNELGMCYGKDKSENIQIPKEIIDNQKIVKDTIRGIVDTDGSIYTANKPGSLNYPSIEITTSSPVLAKQLKETLEKENFRVAKIWSYKSKLSKRTTYKVPLNGRENVRRWVSEIGFSNPYKMNRAMNVLKK